MEVRVVNDVVLDQEVPEILHPVKRFVFDEDRLRPTAVAGIEEVAPNDHILGPFSRFHIPELDHVGVIASAWVFLEVVEVVGFNQHPMHVPEIEGIRTNRMDIV